MAAIRGQPVLGHPGQALSPASAGLNPLSLLPKQVGGLGPGCPKTSCPPIAAIGSFSNG